jgi:hypothetical protein
MSFPSVHVFTDVGVKDTDDELLIKYLCSLSDSPLDLTFVFMGSDGLTASDALVYWVSEFSIKASHVESMNPDTKVSYLTIAEYAALDAVACDYALQIAPMGGYSGSNLTVHGKYIFAGDYVTPSHSEGARDSFNKQGAQDILDRFQDKLIDIPSAHMVNMRFNDELLSKFTGAFRDNIVFTAFLLIFARMSPTHGANKFAEGLINPAAGRGANYTSVMKMKDVFGFETTDSLTVGDQRWCAAENYCSSLEKNGVILKDREGTVKCLTDMNSLLQLISNLGAPRCVVTGDPDYKDIFQSGSVFVSDFDINSIPEDLLPAWGVFKANSASLTECFNPVYDLFAGYVLMGIIKTDLGAGTALNLNRRDHTVEEFQRNVVQEF